MRNITTYLKLMPLIGCGTYKVLCDVLSCMKEKHLNLVKIGHKIKELRAARDFSQDSLAAAAHMGRTYMGRIERGEQNISIQNLIQIAFALNVNVGELIPPLSELQNPATDKSHITV